MHAGPFRRAFFLHGDDLQHLRFLVPLDRYADAGEGPGSILQIRFVFFPCIVAGIFITDRIGKAGIGPFQQVLGLHLIQIMSTDQR